MQRPYRPLFCLHLLGLLLLPSATRAVTTGSDWPGCPEKKESKRGVCVWRGGSTGNNFPGRRKRRWSPEEGAGSLPWGRRRRGARRGQRAAAPAAARSGTDCPTLQRGPGPEPGSRIHKSPAGPALPWRAAAEVLAAPPARPAGDTEPRAAPRSPPPRAGTQVKGWSSRRVSHRAA